jgi:hypothetical protein
MIHFETTQSTTEFLVFDTRGVAKRGAEIYTFRGTHAIFNLSYFNSKAQVFQVEYVSITERYIIRDIKN